MKTTTSATKKFIPNVIGKVRATRSGEKMEIEGQQVGVEGRDGRHWYDIIKGRDEVVYCSCPAWKFQRRPAAQRTCKHLQKFQAVLRGELDGGTGKTNEVIVYASPEPVRAVA